MLQCGVALAVVVAQGIAAAVVGEAVAVHLGQQVFPALGVRIGIAVAVGSVGKAADIAIGVVAVGLRPLGGGSFFMDGFQQLALAIIGIENRSIGRSIGHLGDIAPGVILILEILNRAAVYLILLLRHQGGGGTGAAAGGIAVGFQHLTGDFPGLQAAERVIAKGHAVSGQQTHGGQRAVRDGVRGAAVVRKGLVDRTQAGRRVIPPGQTIVDEYIGNGISGTGIKIRKFLRSPSFRKGLG